MSPFLEVIRSPETSGKSCCVTASQAVLVAVLLEWHACDATSLGSYTCMHACLSRDLEISAPNHYGAGPITGCALGAVRRILDRNVMGERTVQTIVMTLLILPLVSADTPYSSLAMLRRRGTAGHCRGDAQDCRSYHAVQI